MFMPEIKLSGMFVHNARDKHDPEKIKQIYSHKSNRNKPRFMLPGTFIKSDYTEKNVGLLDARTAPNDTDGISTDIVSNDIIRVQCRFKTEEI